MNRVASYLDDLQRLAEAGETSRAEALRRCRWLRSATSDEVDELLQALLQQDSALTAAQHEVLQAGLSHLVHAANSGADLFRDRQTVERSASLYRHLGEQAPARSQILSLLSASRNAESLETFAALITESPPPTAESVAVCFAPLFRHRDYDPNRLFPKLLDGLGHASAAGVILDLANYLTREGVLSQHPAAGRSAELVSILDAMVGHLGQLESAETIDMATTEDTSRRIHQGVALCISLCDAICLIGDPSAAGSLYKAMDLSHRRLRTEAAAALAKLGEQNGMEVLLGLAAEPVARLRVLAYAEELGLLDRVDPSYRSDEAKAAAELALWLAEPGQFGLPPTDIQLVDRRSLYWPGCDEPVTCFLFRFTYDLGQIHLSNLGIAGPLTHAFGADLTTLPLDDVYAAFAGWHGEHEEIYELEAADCDAGQRLEIARLERRLHDRGFHAIEPAMLVVFFEMKALVARARKNGADGIAVVDGEKLLWFPKGEVSRQLEPEDVCCIYKGRMFLDAFNAPAD